MKKYLLIALASVIAAPASLAASYNLSGTLDALQAGTNGGFGSGSSPATGSITGTYDDATNLLNYTLTYSGFTSSVTAIHFHLGAPGVSGGVELGIPTGPSPISQSPTLTSTQETNLLAGNWYINIHTSDFGGGEIRGQVAATAVPEPSALLLGFAGLAGLMLRRRR